MKEKTSPNRSEALNDLYRENVKSECPPQMEEAFLAASVEERVSMLNQKRDAILERLDEMEAIIQEICEEITGLDSGDLSRDIS